MAMMEKTKEEIVKKVWEKAKVVAGYNPNYFRRDACNAMIVLNEYGNRGGKYGWEIDHIVPEVMGGDDELSNMQALHWKNYESKKSNYPNWRCVIRS